MSNVFTLHVFSLDSWVLNQDSTPARSCYHFVSSKLALPARCCIIWNYWTVQFWPSKVKSAQKLNSFSFSTSFRKSESDQNSAGSVQTSVSIPFPFWFFCRIRKFCLLLYVSSCSCSPSSTPEICAVSRGTLVESDFPISCQFSFLPVPVSRRM